MIDLQLPGQDQVEYIEPIQQEEEPKEKTEFKNKFLIPLIWNAMLWIEWSAKPDCYFGP